MSCHGHVMHNTADGQAQHSVQSTCPIDLLLPHHLHAARVTPVYGVPIRRAEVWGRTWRFATTGAPERSVWCCAMRVGMSVM